MGTKGTVIIQNVDSQISQGKSCIVLLTPHVPDFIGLSHAGDLVGVALVHLHGRGDVQPVHQVRFPACQGRAVSGED